MIFTELNEDNYMMFAIKNYSNLHASTKDDFFDDMKRFKYIKRLLRRYKKTGILKYSLVINHFIIIYNIFQDAATPLLFFKIDKDLWPVMKSFIVYLNRLPEFPKCYIHDIPVDENCHRSLQLIYDEKE
ncbi:hypothetical protein EBS02_02970 [bacterium]|nr:hypothetical protein [bacterium]